MIQNKSQDGPMNDDRGQVGIGTLIVFIALVLVAAIAAGVLINTAGFLQNQAEATGQESTEQVSNAIQVTSAFGEGTSTSIDTVTLVVSKAPGADSIDLSNAEIEWVNEDGSSAVHRFSPDDTTDGVTTNEIVGSSGSNLLSDDGEKIEVKIDTSTADPDAISAGGSATLTITTADGGQTTVELSVPNPLSPPVEL